MVLTEGVTATTVALLYLVVSLANHLIGYGSKVGHGGERLAIPDYQALMRPLLEFASDGAEHSVAEARERLALLFKLTEEEQKELLPSGRQPVFTNRVAWAKVYLGQAGALDTPRRGWFQINERGRQLLKDVSGPINKKHLERFPDFNLFRQRSKEIHDQVPDIAEGQTPEEMLESAYQKFHAELAGELLAGSRRRLPGFSNSSWWNSC